MYSLSTINLPIVLVNGSLDKYNCVFEFSKVGFFLNFTSSSPKLEVLSIELVVLLDVVQLKNATRINTKNKLFIFK